MQNKFEALKLSNQLCFPLYACAKEIIRTYGPFLEEIDLTYTQYITMLVIWEEKKIYVKDLGKKLYLDSGTLTPVLKKLEAKNLVLRERCKSDERNLCVILTQEGEKLKEKAADIPIKMGDCINLDAQERKTLANLLDKLLSGITDL